MLICHTSCLILSYFLSILSLSSIFQVLSFNLTSLLSVHLQVSFTSFFPFSLDSIYSTTMSSCLGCGTCFPQCSVSIQVALFQNLDGDDKPIWWFLFWYQGITIQCVLTQFIEHCYTVFGQRPQHIDEVDVIIGDLQFGGPGHDEQVLREVITLDNIASHLTISLFITFEYPIEWKERIC